MRPSSSPLSPNSQELNIAFQNRTVSQFGCNWATDCGHLTGEEIDTAMATITDDSVSFPDGGQPSPTFLKDWWMFS